MDNINLVLLILWNLDCIH